MRILLMSPVYPPEFGAGVHRLKSLTRELVAKGHHVSVATGMPNYPRGKVYPGYGGKLVSHEVREGADVYRTVNYMVPRNKSKVGQLLSYLTFLPALAVGGLRAGKLDAVFVTSPPHWNVLAAILVARLRGAKLVFDLRDLWPDEVVACGAARESSLFVRVSRAIERWGYRAADLITCTTRAFMETLEERGVPASKLAFAPNGADVEFFAPRPADNSVAREYPFGDRFVVMYSGLFGLKFGLETILEAAALLKDRKDIVFFLRGAGSRRDDLVEQARKAGLDNTLFGEERDLADVPDLIARADVCVTCLMPDPYLQKIVSVKIYEYLACARPIVAALGGEGARVIEEAGGGVVVSPGDARGMADAILKLRDDPELRARMGVSGRRHILEHYDRRVTADRLEAAIRAVVPTPRSVEPALTH